MQDSADDVRPPFLDRHAAGIQLARAMSPEPETIVLGVARGGVVVAAAVAHAWHTPLDVLVVRKVGHPLQPELAIGAVTAHGDAVSTEHAAAFPEPILKTLFARASHEAAALEERLRAHSQPLDLANRPVVIVDDGIATSATVLCALQYARRLRAKRVTCAVPVAPVDSLQIIRSQYDGVVVLTASHDIPFAVGRFYLFFQEVSDARVREELARN